MIFDLPISQIEAAYNQALRIAKLENSKQ